MFIFRKMFKVSITAASPTPEDHDYAIELLWRDNRNAVFWDRSKLEFPDVLMLERLKKYCILELYFTFQNCFVSLHAQTWQA